MTEGLRSLAAGAALALALAAACAHVEAPTGGPPDETAPKLLVTQPDTNARLTSFRGPAIFVFDEGLSEKGVEEAVNLSPATSRISIDKRGDEIRVEPRRGWETGRVYQVEVGPGIQDRFGNRTTERHRLVFSTGPEIPDTRFAGTVLERTTTRPSVGARVEAVLLPDSLVYSTVTDSAGAFVFAQVPAGEYVLRAYTDQNRSRELDEFEARDTTRVRVAVRDTAAPAARLSIIRPDTSAPRVTGATASSDTVVEVRFDDFLDPTQTVSPAQVTVAGPGAPVVVEIRFAAFAAATVADSTQPAAEPGDTGALRRPPAGEVTRPLPPGQSGGSLRPAGTPAEEARRAAARDSAGAAAAAAQEPQGPVPSQSLFVRLSRPLAPDTAYTVTVTGVRNLLGLVGGGEAPLRTPRPRPAAADSVGAPRAVPRPGEGGAVRPPADAPRPPAGQGNPPAPAPTPPPPPPAPPQTPPGRERE